MVELEKTKQVYEEVFRHLQDSTDEMYKIGMQNSLVYREMQCLMDYLNDIL